MSRKVAFYGIFAALGILMGYVEAILPSPVPIQGVKLGLANVIVLIAMYFMGGKAALGINVIRVLISALLFNGFSGFLYSMAGAGASFIVMLLAKKIKSSGIIGVSVLGGVTHNGCGCPGTWNAGAYVLCTGAACFRNGHGSHHRNGGKILSETYRKGWI